MEFDKVVNMIEIETTIGNLYVQGKPYHPAVERLQLHREDGEWVNAHLKCQVLSPEIEIRSMRIFSPIINDLIDWTSIIPVVPCFYEQREYEFVFQINEAITYPINFYHSNAQIREAISHKGKNILSGILNFRNEVGFTQLDLHTNGKRLLTLEIEIFPSKLDYKKDYMMLLKEINAQVYNLSFDFLKRTYQSVELRDSSQPSLSEFFSIISHLFEQIERAMERIQTQPHHNMERELELRNAPLVKRPSSRNVSYLARHPKYLEKLHSQYSRQSFNDIDHNQGAGYIQSPPPGTIPIAGEAYRPTRLLDTVKRLSYDTAENRFLRWMLERILMRLNQLNEQYEQLSRPSNYRSRSYDEQFSLVVAQMIRRLERMLSADWLQKLTPMRSMSISLVMQMAPGYREMYRYYLTLLKGLSIQSDLLRLSMKEISELYEYWCFLKLNELLARKYSLVEQSVIKLNHSGLFVTLDRGQQSQMKYRHPRTGELFVLYYNSAPKGTASPTLAQRPDNVLSLHKQDAGKQKTYNFIFDAKYRIHVAEQGSAYRAMYKQPGPQEEDINTMHRYRDAMVHLDDSLAEDRERYERTMYGAYVLFPYSDEEQYREHHFYKSIQRINVGALPFLPNATSLVEQFLDELIADSPEKSYERATVPQRTEEYYEDAIEQRQRNMLIGSVRGREQVELALKHRFYHVPLRNLNDVQVVTQLNYVAMYQSKRSFGAQGQEGIRYYGRITGWQIMRRGDIDELLPDERKQDQLYVKLNVEDWQERTPAIMPGGQGIYTLLLTSKYMFDRADELAELRLETEEQLTQWREKRRQGRVKVTLDQHYADLAEKVLDITVEPESE
ncbi:DUF2357 domain-containing protein [Paenibacillus hunanensis]|uniref:DUF2357 domain-containing protein n=2 Tax=Paenibacillus hunanensis TaxID=539262 RepID=UPI00166BDECC|nr:DUF2357 domain-containing protein [Paenibacillus hunanensis]GGJ33059.1 hypothetical protein GCM10008022_47210 [Paenibacillus hunanensis]